MPSFVIEDAYTQAYYDLNLSDPKAMFIRGLMRIDLVHLSRFSLGYQFWGHQLDYTNSPPDGVIMLDVDFPHSETYSFHAMTLQWKLDYPWISSRVVTPFLLAGGGRYYGNSEKYRYMYTDEVQQSADKVVTATATHEGWGVTAGGGLLFFRHVFIYAGLIDFMDRELPASRFMDVTVGVTF